MLAKAFASQSPMMQALEVFAVLMSGRVLSAIGLVRGALVGLAALPAPAWLLAAAGLSGVAQWEGAKETAKTLGSDDPTKNDVVVDPESGMATKVGEGEGNQGTGPNTGFNRQTGFIPWFKRLIGLGGADDPKTKEHIGDTAKATGEIRDILKAQKDGMQGGAFSGVTASSGGVGGSGQHFGGGSSPGAALGDRAQGGAGGSRAWRNNNPGNISYGKFAKEHGADGSDGRFAHFPSYEAGRKAQEALWFDSDLYKGLTLAQATSKWSPPGENDTAGLIRRYAAAAGVDANTPLSQFTPEQRGKLLDAQQAIEGWKAGTRQNGVAAVSGDSPEVAEARRYLAQTATGAAAQRSDSIVKLNPAFALAAAKAIKQARAEGINAGIGSGYRSFGQTGSAYDAQGFSSHSYGIASDFSGIGVPGSAEARRFDEIARAAGLGGYGPDNPREWNHKELGSHLQHDRERLAAMRATLGPNGEMVDPQATWRASGYVLAPGAVEKFPEVEKAPPPPLAGRTFGSYVHDSGGGPGVKPQGEQKPKGETLPKHGHAYPGWMSKGSDGETYSTADMRDPRFAPKPVAPHPDDDRSSRARVADAPEHPTVAHAARAFMSALHRAQRLTTHANDNGPVPVEVTDKSTANLGAEIGKTGLTMLSERRAGAIHAAVSHRLARDAEHWKKAEAHSRMMRVAERGMVAHHATTHNIDRSVTSDTKIAAINIHTQARDAHQIAADIEPHLRRGDLAGRADYGLG